MARYIFLENETNPATELAYPIELIDVEDCFKMKVLFKNQDDIEDTIGIIRAAQRSFSVDDGHQPDFELNSEGNCLYVEGNLRSCLVILCSVDMLDQITTRKIVDNLENDIAKSGKDIELLMTCHKNFHQVRTRSVYCDSGKERDFLKPIVETKKQPYVEISFSGIFFVALEFDRENDAIAILKKIEGFNYSYALAQDGLNLYVYGNLIEFFNFFHQIEKISNETLTVLCNKLLSYSEDANKHLVADACPSNTIFDSDNSSSYGGGQNANDAERPRF